MRNLSLGTACLLAVVLCQNQSHAQRQEVPQPQPPVASPAQAESATGAPVHPIIEREIFDAGYTPVEGDLPDFAPTEEILNDEGMVVSTRLVGNPYRLSFIGGSFEPQPGLDPRLREWLQQNPQADVHAFIMIKGRMADAEKQEALKKAGAVLLGEHTWQSYKARIPAASVPTVAGLEFVHWVGFPLPGQKLDPVLVESLSGAAVGQRFEIYVNLFESAINADSRTIVDGEVRAHDSIAVVAPTRKVVPNGPWQAAVAATGMEITFYCPYIHAFRGMATAEQILAMREMTFVQFIEPCPVHTTGHDQSMAMIGQDRVRTAYPGNNVSVGIIDTGVNSSPWHNDLTAKGYVGWQTTTATVFNDQHGHGTHVAGTTFGRGAAQSRFRGAAPNVGAGGEGDRAFIGRYLSDTGGGQGDVSVLYSAFASDFVNNSVTNPRPRFINNSWGSRSATGYSGTEAGARQIDTVVYDNNQCYVFITHNTGGAPGTWCGSPGSAKNVLTVGGVQDTWSATSQPGSVYTGTRWATTDNRFKPEIVAVAHQVTSCNINTATGYRNMSGTSMAAPHVAGILASLRNRSSFYDLSPAPTKALAAAAAKFNGSPTRDGSRQLGYGTINSYKMNFASGRHTFSTNKGSLTSSGTFQSFDLAIPANVTAIKAVLSWIEPAASSGASAARTRDVRAWFDLPPYTVPGNSGEFSMSSGIDNTIYYMSYAGPAGNFATQAAGQTVRFKVYGQSVASRINWGLSVFMYFNNSRGVPTMSSTISSTLLAPSALVTMTPRLVSGSANDDFDAGRIYPVLPSGWTVTRLERTLVDGVVQVYTGTTHTSNPFPSLTGGMAVGQGINRPAIFTLRAPTLSGNYTLRFEGTKFPGSTTLATTQSVCVDGLAPNLIGNLRSTSHTANVWNSSRNLAMAWNTATDVGCSGIDAVLYTRTQGAPGTPSSNLAAGAVGVTLNNVAETTSAANGHYVAVRARDRIGNLGAVGSVGPFLVDATVPVLSSLTIAGGATRTSSLNVNLALSYSDAHSGVADMQFSSNNSTWSAWVPVAGTTNYTLSSNGGNTNEGMKTVYARVRDRAGNVSAVRSASIEYMRLPSLSPAAPASLPNVTDLAFVISGTDMLGITSVQFGTTTLSSTSRDNWHVGYFETPNDTTLRVYPPQGLAATTYSIRATNPVGQSNAITVSLTHPASITLRTHTNLTAGRPQTIFVHRAGLANPAFSMLTISPHRTPSVLPGLVSLEIGNMFASLTVLGVNFPHVAATGVATIGPFPTMATMAGAQLHFETITFSVPVAPLPTSNAWTTNYR